MSHSGNMRSVKVEGELALFTRPESRIDRISYDVMTPEAARGILESVLWKPEIAWRVRRIDVLRPIRWQELRRNELSSKASPRGGRADPARAIAEAQGGEVALLVDQRAQMTSRYLRDVSYVIHAEMIRQPHASEPITKYLGMFDRRLAQGQHHRQPCLGKRELLAHVEPARGDEQPIDMDLDLGMMTLRMNFVEGEPRAGSKPVQTLQIGPGGKRYLAMGSFQPQMFHAVLRRGSLHIPQDGHA